MKRNRIFQKYGDKLVRQITKADASNISVIKESLNEISVYIKGLVSLIVQENSKGEEFLYDQFIRKSRGYFSRLETYIYSQYNKIARASTKTTKEIYNTYRAELISTIKKAKFNPKIDAKLSEAINVHFRGTPTQSFKRHLKSQLQVGIEPASLIKTVSTDHVKLIQRQMMTAVAKGKGNGWAVDKIMNEIYPNFKDRLINSQMEYNVTRITRTSFAAAVNNDTAEFVDVNSDIFIGNRRVADGRPCIACIVQDGRFYEPGVPLIDHPNGMCILVPISYPDEYFMTGRITKPIRDTFDEPLASKLYRMSESQQRAIFNNNALYSLWKKEKFDLDKMVVGKFDTPISYRAAVMNLDKMGGISGTRVNFLSPQAKAKLNSVIDPKDRVQRNITIVRDSIKGGKNSYGLDYTEVSPDYMKAKISNKLKAKVNALFGNGDLDWYQFNRRARALNLWVRKDVNGRIYYAVPNKQVQKQVVVTKKKVATKQTLDVNKIIEDFKDEFNNITVAKVHDVRQGVNFSSVVESDKGKMYFTKSARLDLQNEIGFEEGYYKFASELGFDIVPKTANLSKKRVVQEFIDEKDFTVFRYLLGEDYRVAKKLEAFIATEKGQQWFVLDYLLGAVDRHAGNFFVKLKNSKIVDIRLVDNGRALTKMRNTLGNNDLDDYLWEYGKIKFSSSVIKSVENYAKRLGWKRGLMGTAKEEQMWKTVTKNLYNDLRPYVQDGTRFGDGKQIDGITERLRLVLTNKKIVIKDTKERIVK